MHVGVCMRGMVRRATRRASSAEIQFGYRAHPQLRRQQCRIPTPATRCSRRTCAEPSASRWASWRRLGHPCWETSRSLARCLPAQPGRTRLLRAQSHHPQQGVAEVCPLHAVRGALRIAVRGSLAKTVPAIAATAVAAYVVNLLPQVARRVVREVIAHGPSKVPGGEQRKARGMRHRTPRQPPREPGVLRLKRHRPCPWALCWEATSTKSAPAST